MDKNFKPSKFLRKAVVSTTLNSIAFNGCQLIRYVMPQWERNVVCCRPVFNKTSHQNKSYGCENKNQYRQNKIFVKKCEKKVSKPFNPQAFL